MYAEDARFRSRIDMSRFRFGVGRGESVVFATRDRPVAGTRGDYRVNMRHGVSTVTDGSRLTLGIIFHDAR